MGSICSVPFNAYSFLSQNFQVLIISVLQEEVAKEFGIPVQCQRFWIWAKRQNHTYRPNRPLTPQEEAQSVSIYPSLLLLLSISLSCLV